jgi:profilin
MIWQSFVDETILGTSQVAKAAIHGLDGTRFAASTGFVVRCYFFLLIKRTNISVHTDRYVNIHGHAYCSKYTASRTVDFSNRTREIYFVVTTIPLL